ncbi:MAG: UvrD-helicase domain-containing protein [Solirubrobacteraceae bacterium]
MSVAPITIPPREFDVCGSLPSGVTVLEASAGTGKTYTIAALAARYVAEGVALQRLLLVTFTRIATSELRERVRERLVAVERGLARVLAGAGPGDDPVVALLADEHAGRRRELLASAIAGFDAATIATTHGFCQEVLGGLGIAGDLEPDVAFVEDLSDLVSEVVDDLYVRRFSRGGPAAFDRAQAAEIARAAIENPTATIVGTGSEVAAMRVRLALSARAELERRKRAMAVMTYDDLVTRLRSALTGPGAQATAARLRDRFDVVLVDEFQDTDPAQWEIMRRAFADGGATLVLIADPKQAIYAFRGADVYAYLDAARTAGAQATLPINWRSDQGLIDAHDALFTGVRLGHQGIPYRHVRAAPRHHRSRLSGAPVAAPMRFRVAARDDPALSLTKGGYVRNVSARRLIARDLAGDVVALLDSGARVAPYRPGDRRDTDATVSPGHLAVLVRTNRQAAMIRDALHDAGVPAVINGAGSVFATASAREWLTLLEALERPASITRARAAAITGFVGWSARRLAQDAADEDAPAWEEVHQRLHGWARILRERGVAALVEVISVDQGLPARILARAAGERRLTDLRHIGQLLHGAAGAEQLGPSALTAWLRTRIAQADADTADEERSRRLESDAEAVQVLTIHRSKGLEFPIVYLPFLWEPGFIPRAACPVFFHDPAAGDERTIDVGLAGRDYDAHREQFVREQRGEDLRLAYVALTRARHQVVVWWAGSWDSRDSPLGRLLFSRDANGEVAPRGTFTPADAAVRARLGTLAGGGAISVERAGLSLPASWSPPLPAPAALSSCTFGRRLDLRWRRTSYSDITAGGQEARVGSEPEEPLLADEPAAEPAPPGPVAGGPAAIGTATPSLLGEMPVGVHVGTFVHRVMEATDFRAGDLEAELTDRLADVQGRRPVEIGDPAAVVAGLRAVIETPLGPILGGVALCDIGRTDRLDELGFELPLAGGDRPSGWLTLARIASLLAAHLDAGDPLAGYGERLRDAGLRQRVRGYLTGSLDLVVRVPGDGGPRFAVLDYKTNWLAGIDEPLTTAHYRPEALAAEMHRHHYALQALLYVVALHRYLRWRLPEYDPDRHLAGVVYLFVRGMTGPGAPVLDGVPSGVFGWRPPIGLVPALSDALDREDEPAAAQEALW